MSVSRITDYDLGKQHTAAVNLLMCCRAAPRTRKEAIRQVVEVTGFSELIVSNAFAACVHDGNLVREAAGWIAV
jgi:hypothetical protein